MKIEGKIAWITGASSGIGEALADGLFRQGITGIRSARNIDKLNIIKNRLDKKEKGRCYLVACDVTIQSEIERAIAEIKKLVDRVDILINNAGVSQRSYALETDISVDRSLFEVNFFGAV